jgi:hypothetical protein
MDQWLDNLARRLAQSAPRRVLLQGVLGALGAAVLGSLLPRRDSSGPNPEPWDAVNAQTCIPDGGQCQGSPVQGGGCCSGICGPGRICQALTATPTLVS